MKKILMISAALVAIFLSASCQKDTLAPGANDPVATFEVQMPGAYLTKAIADGTTATELLYGVYAVNTVKDETTGESDVTYTFVESGKVVSEESLKFEAELRLVTNVSYRVVFWAQAPGNSAYDVDFENATVVADYSSACKANDETRDAFYNYIDVKMTKDETFPVELFRPLAQINFGSDKVDYNALSHFLSKGLKSTIAVEGIHDTLCLTDGTLSGSAKVEFTSEFAPVYNKEVLKGYADKYEYVGMNYIFANSQKQNMSKELVATFTHDSDDIVVTVPNIPYCANFRTNILGFLFTEKLITNIEVKPIPEGDEIVDLEIHNQNK